MTAYRLDPAALHTRLDHQRRQRGLSWSAVARETGVPKSLFTKLGQGDGAPSAHALLTLIQWLGLGRDLIPILAPDTPPGP